MHCGRCESDAFVIDGKMACCDAVVDLPTKEVHHRESESYKFRQKISPKDKKDLLKSQEGRCGYCLYLIGDTIENEKTGKRIKLEMHVDHFIPWSYLSTNKGELIASCQLCNLIKSNKVFDSLDSLRVFLKDQRRQQGWPNDGMVSVIWKHVRESLRSREHGNTSVP